MKNLSKLALFFSLNFLIIFLAATGLRFLALGVEWARQLPQRPETFLTLVITAAHWALSFALYYTILLTLCYAARRNYFGLMPVSCIMVLSIFLCFGISLALHYWKYVPPAETAGRQIGENGLVLSNTLHRNETAVILLRGTADPFGPRVTAIPDRPLVFQESTANARISLPPVPFGNDTPWFVESLFIDIRLNAEQLKQRLNEGFLSFFIYSGALIFLLSSLGFAIKISVWPLANLFIGIIVFRGILAAETFLNSLEMQEILGSFFMNIIPTTMAVPLIFCLLGLLVHVYSILVYISKKRDKDGY